MENTVFLCGNGNHPLFAQVLRKLGEFFGQSCKFDHIYFNKYPEGELDNRIPKYEKIKGKTIVLFQSFKSMEFLELLCETLDLLWALKHQYGAKRIIVIFSFLCNRRQDPLMETDPNNIWKTPKPDEFQRLRMTISFLSHCGVDEIVVPTPHSGEMKKACKEYNIIFHEIDLSHLFAEAIKTFVSEDDLSLVNIYAPDLGSIPRAVNLAKILTCPVLFNLKNRIIYNQTSIKEEKEEELKEIMENLIEQYNFSKIHYVTKELVTGKIMAIVEDEIASGGTANDTGQMLKRLNSKYNLLFATHPLFTWGWRNKLFFKNPFEKIAITDSIERPYEKRTGGQLVDISIAPIIASTLFRILRSS
jgi:phosphoribosylpyrophosphate synthetase